MSTKTEEKEGMSRGDRQELRRVVKGRFQLLQDELENRINEVKRIIRENIKEQRKADIKKAEEQGQALLKEVEEVADRVIAFRRKHEAKGLSPAGGSKSDRQYYFNGLRDSITGWQPSKLTDQVNEEFDRFKREAGNARMSIRGQELKLLEQLSVDALQSETAREFLGEIPDIDDILPIPSADTKALTVGGN